jgi:hypothetical protein
MELQANVILLIISKLTSKSSRTLCALNYYMSELESLDIVYLTAEYLLLKLDHTDHTIQKIFI